MRIELGQESEPTSCECCGNVSHTVWGYVYRGEAALAAYFVQWTSENPMHPPNVDFLIGTWGGDETNDKILVSWIYNANPGGGSFQVIDSAQRPAASSSLCSKALNRDEVVMNKDLMGACAEMLDAIWLRDPRIKEVTEFKKNA